MDDYQVLNSQDSPVYGIPEYDGLEYDYEVPNQMIVESPGGASSTHHHWTKGFYGEGGSSWDIFGGDPPAPVYGNTGSLYATGPTATQVSASTAPGPGTFYASPPVGMSPQFLGNQPPPNPPPEPFNTNDNIEYLDAGGTTREKYVPSAGETKIKESFSNAEMNGMNGKSIILIIASVFVAYFWAHLGLSFLKHRYSGTLPLEILGGYTLALTFIFIILIWKFKV